MIQKPVKTRSMMLISIVPFGWLYVFNKLHKLKIGIGLTVLFFVVAEITQLLLPQPFGLLTSIIVLGAIELTIVKKYCNEYNRSLLK